MTLRTLFAVLALAAALSACRVTKTTTRTYSEPSEEDPTEEVVVTETKTTSSGVSGDSVVDSTFQLAGSVIAVPFKVGGAFLGTIF